MESCRCFLLFPSVDLQQEQGRLTEKIPIKKDLSGAFYGYSYSNAAFDVSNSKMVSPLLLR